MGRLRYASWAGRGRGCWRHWMLATRLGCVDVWFGRWEDVSALSSGGDVVCVCGGWFEPGTRLGTIRARHVIGPSSYECLLGRPITRSESSRIRSPGSPGMRRHKTLSIAAHPSVHYLVALHLFSGPRDRDGGFKVPCGRHHPTCQIWLRFDQMWRLTNIPVRLFWYLNLGVN